MDHNGPMNLAGLVRVSVVTQQTLFTRTLNPKP